uniref:Uncharacterized protein n=1 Tax=Cucumis melo TaxID=3656 RepID=A0A9I9D5U7_CUCME
MFFRHLFKLADGYNHGTLEWICWSVHEAIIKKRPSRNDVQNFWLYVFGMAFNAIAMMIQDFDAIANKGSFMVTHLLRFS